MPRTARERTESGYYHVVVESSPGLRIFEEQEARDFYLEKLLLYVDRFDLGLLAYAFCGDHCHLLIQEGEIDVSGLMRRMGVSFSHWYRKTHPELSDKVFNGRYRSDPIAERWELNATLHYIETEQERFAARHSFAYRSVPEDLEVAEARAIYKSPAEGVPDKTMLDVPKHRRQIPQATAERLYRTRLREHRHHGRLSLGDRDEMIYALRFKDGMTIRQVMQLTGYTRGVVQRIKKRPY